MPIPYTSKAPCLRYYISVMPEAFYPIHTSSDFYIYGESSHDEFVIETDLVSGFPPYDYDVMIELYDSQTGELLAFANQNNDADLAYIPLESADYDDNTGGGSVVVVTEHGGTFSGTLLAFMGIIGLWRIVRAKNWFINSANQGFIFGNNGESVPQWS